MMAALKYLASRPERALKALVDPALFWRATDLVFDRLGAIFEEPAAPSEYHLDEDWEARLHEHLGVTHCAEPQMFEELWSKVNQSLANRGFRLGPQSYFGFNDGDPEFVHAIWCLVRHLRPEHVVETGVAHGLTSRMILEAMAANQKGHLWSIDKPPFDPVTAAQIGAAIEGPVIERWTLLKGSSRQCLPSLVREIGKIDIFIHDSLHTDRNVRLEVGEALRVLDASGYIVIDDIDVNAAFPKLVKRLRPPMALVCQSRPMRGDERRFDGKGLFGIIALGKCAQEECSP